MENNISPLFYARTSKKSKEELIPVYVRITIDGKRIEQSINKPIEPTKWSKDTGRIKGIF